MSAQRVSRGSLPQQLRRLSSLGIVLGSLIEIPSAFQILFSEPASSAAIAPSSAAIVARGSDGLFHTTLRIGDKAADCLIDTGATNLVLSEELASGSIIRSTRSAKAGRLITASGTIAAAHVRLDAVSLAGHEFKNVPAVLIRGRTKCLIGQDMLDRIGNLALDGDKLYLG